MPALWLVGADGSGAHRLAPGDVSAADPAWSPDGTTLATVATDAAGHARILLIPAAGGTSARPLEIGAASPANLAWNRDGTAIAYTAFVPDPAAALAIPMPEKPAGATWAPSPHVTTAADYQADGAGFLPQGRTCLFVVATRTGRVAAVPTPALDIRGTPSWTPDGAGLVFAAHPHPGPIGPEQDALFRATLATGALTRLSPGAAATPNAAPNAGLDAGTDLAPAISPDGATIAYLRAPRTGFWHSAAWTMRSDGSDPHPLLAGLDRDVTQISWSRDGTLFVSYEDRGIGTVARLVSDRRAVPVVTDLSGDDAFSLSDRGQVGFARGTPDRPDAAAVAAPTGGTERTVTHADDALLETRALARLRPFDVRSSYDGTRIPGFLLLPPGASPGHLGHPLPTILWIHGGPYGDEGPQWDMARELLAAAGYAVLYMNPRGAQSYGFAYEAKLPVPAPGHDVDDLMSAVDAAVAQRIADPARLYVTGQSYGGGMTAWLVGTTTRFRAAVADKPIIDALANVLEDDQYVNTPADGQAPPWTDPELWWRRSPLSRVGKVRTPTMLLVGADDHRTPVTQSEMFYDALQLRHVPAALVVYPGASHETLVSRPSRLASVAAATLAWFARYR